MLIVREGREVVGPLLKGKPPGAAVADAWIFWPNETASPASAAITSQMGVK
jgi:hypothetical protein